VSFGLDWWDWIGALETSYSEITKNI